MSGAIAEIFIDNGFHTPTLRIGQGQRFVYDVGGRKAIWKKYGLDEESVANKIMRWMG